jgi:hypothetical protein
LNRQERSRRAGLDKQFMFIEAAFRKAPRDKIAEKPQYGKMISDAASCMIILIRRRRKRYRTGYTPSGSAEGR